MSVYDPLLSSSPTWLRRAVERRADIETEVMSERDADLAADERLGDADTLHGHI